jgi:methionyl-tRNA formyltransferase
MDRISGVTAMKMDEGLDTGDILAYSVLNIEGLNSIELFDNLSQIASSLTPKVLKEYEKIKAIAQTDVIATHTKKIKKEDGLVEFESAKRVDAKYRAFIAWPGVYLESGLRLKELKLHCEDGSYKSGEILEIGKDFALIGCKEGVLKIFIVQAPSKKEVDTASYLRGKRLGVGDTLI